MGICLSSCVSAKYYSGVIHEFTFVEPMPMDANSQFEFSAAFDLNYKNLIQKKDNINIPLVFITAYKNGFDCKINTNYKFNLMQAGFLERASLKSNALQARFSKIKIEVKEIPGYYVHVIQNAVAVVSIGGVAGSFQELHPIQTDLTADFECILSGEVVQSGTISIKNNQSPYLAPEGELSLFTQAYFLQHEREMKKLGAKLFDVLTIRLNE